uniref:Uncharacterized protein n=1 Tax=Arundo donax TaxID=35708 RepID=A0A0A8YK97_ARUDO
MRLWIDPARVIFSSPFSAILFF